MAAFLPRRAVFASIYCSFDRGKVAGAAVKVRVLAIPRFFCDGVLFSLALSHTAAATSLARALESLLWPQRLQPFVDMGQLVVLPGDPQSFAYLVGQSCPGQRLRTPDPCVIAHLLELSHAGDVLARKNVGHPQIICKRAG